MYLPTDLVDDSNPEYYTEDVYSSNAPRNYGRSKDIQNGKLECLFEKKFKYNKFNSKWSLPPHRELFKEYYQFENFQQLKQDLNAVKSKLNDYVIEDWSAHTRKKDPSSEIPWKLKNDIKAEFVTVAWCKLFECLHQYKIVKSGKLNSLHLCEAPGAFIAALNHYLQSTYDEVHWNWLSTTLNPYYEGNPLNKMIMDDRFMLYTLDRWLFHEDFSGNIMDRGSIQHMANECKDRLGEVHLITADGSVDCIETPDNQEEFVSTLHFAEVCAALLILSKGGSFVLKMFTLFEALSVGLVYFLNCVFEEVNVFKPATSKRGNSEIYLICLDYHKPENINDYLNVMMDKVNTQNIFPLFPKRFIPVDFCMQHEVCTRRFMFEQISAIESNIYSYDLKCRWNNRQCHELRSQVCKLFLERYKVKPIPAEKMILQNPQSKIQHGVHTQIYRGSYTERLCVRNLSTEEQVVLLCKALNNIEKSFLWEYEEMACFHRSPEDQLPLKLFKGKPLDEILSSLFASVEILFLRTKVTALYGVDPVFQSKPHCTLGDANKTDTWSFHIESHSSNNITEKQREFFSEILKIIIDHQPKRINFVNVPFLTHYSVSILRYLAANLYDTCRISGTREITLELEKECNEEAIQTVRDLYKILTEHPEVLCFVDIVHLHRNHFSKIITDYNNQLLINNYKIRLSAE